MFAERAAEVGQEVIRVSAVDGNAIAADQRAGLNVRLFQLCHGRTPLGSEYGCYMSHIDALRQFVAMDISYAIILEDDAGLPDDFITRIAAIVEADEDVGLVKLFNHRIMGFVRKKTTGLGDDLGRCVHGPLGSSMGYLVDRKSAVRLIEGLLPMFLPFDIALERYWRYGNKFQLAEKNILEPLPSREISTLFMQGQNYRSTKLPLLLRTPTALFRGAEYVRRAIGAVGR